MGQVKRSGVGGGKRKEKTPSRKHCENEKHPLIIAVDLCSGNEKRTNQHRTTIVPEAPFTSDKIKINTAVVYIMQAGSCSREGEYCRLTRVSVIIVGYVRFRFKLNMEAILESKVILLQYFFSPPPPLGLLFLLSLIFLRHNHREPTQSVCVADCYFVVNVLDLTLKSYKLSKINSPVNPGMLEAQHQTNCNRIVFNAI